MILIIALALIASVLGLLLSRKVSPVAAFVVLPPLAGLLTGASVTDLGRFITEGLQTVFPTAVMFIFAVLFFGILRERGLFAPVVRVMLRVGGSDPLRLYAATVLLAAVVHLDGVGPATVLLTIPALLPVYRRLGISPLRLLLFIGASVGVMNLVPCRGQRVHGRVGASVGVMNLVPWGGPTARAASALKLEAAALWYPLIPVQLIGLVAALALAVLLGLRDRRMVQQAVPQDVPQSASLEKGAGFREDGQPTVRNSPPTLRLKLQYAVNLLVLLAVLMGLFLRILPLNITFMIGLGVALLVNFRGFKAQAEAIERHARDAINLAVVLLAVSVFLGVLTGTGMVAELSSGLAGIFPAGAAQYLHLVVGALATPIGMAVGPDPYYFGMLPVFAGIAETAGVVSTGVASIGVASAMLLGENLVILLSPMIPVAYLASSLAQVDLAQTIRANFLYLWGLSLVMLLAAVLLEVVP